MRRLSRASKLGRAASLESLEVRRFLSASSLDGSFDGDGSRVDDFDPNDLGISVVIQPWDDRIVAVNFSGPSLVRYNTDGTLDGTFGVGGVVDLVPFGFEDAVDVAIAPGNKLVVVGDQSTNSGDFRVARFDSLGAIDPTFGGGSVQIDVGVGTADIASAVAVRNDGSVVIAGTSSGDFLCAQLDSMGVLDGGFGTGGYTFAALGPSAMCANMTLRADGTAVLVGQVLNVDEDFALALVDSGGVLGTTDVQDFGGSEFLTSAVTTPGGDIYAVGQQAPAGVLVHYSSTGVYDATFAGAVDGIVAVTGASDGAFNVARDASGNLLIVGSDGSGQFSLSRYTAAGAADMTFDGNGNVLTPIGVFALSTSVATQADGRIVVLGMSDGDLALARYGDPTTVTVQLQGPDLVITGTAGAESIVITRNTAGINVDVGGTTVGTGFNPTGIISVSLGDGNDQLNVASSVTTPLFIDAGDGEDTIKGGNGNDILLGGAGLDRLMGSGGRDLMIGGTGTDRMLGDNEDDIMIASSTTHDTDSAALFAIHTEWTSTRSYAVRVNNIRDGSGSVLRNNGGFFFDAVTVVDDGVADTLSGNAGSDWFIFNEGNDTITDLHRNEFGEDLV